MRSSAETVNLWRDRIDRCLASELSIHQWCELNGVNRSSLYYWFRRLGVKLPSSVDARTAQTDGWLKLSCTDLAPADPPTGMLACRCADDPGASVSATPASASDAPAPIRIALNGALIDVPQGAKSSDIASVLQAVSAL